MHCSICGDDSPLLLDINPALQCLSVAFQVGSLMYKALNGLVPKCLGDHFLS